MGKRDGAQGKGSGSSLQIKGSESRSANDKQKKPFNPAPRVSRGMENDAELMATPEDPQFRYPHTITAEEAGFDNRFHLVHGFWVPSVRAADYRRIVERFGHMCVHEEMPVNSLIVVAEDLLGITDGLAQAEETPIDPDTLRKWEAFIQTYLLIRFPIQWLKDLLNALPREIEKLDQEYRRLLNVANVKKEAYDRLIEDVGRSTKELRDARVAAEEVNARIVKKRAELTALNIN
ncbi:uncharacterized protein LOC113361636 [Papaver somniferum]|uniref:uncharacterized protein LOC113361636 n=1 Tax=Papaver somniferum TaxID=3469 RepID=UPI000E6FEB74|nr:uncharacterized protein LOC113361636 [Papaver somniferum]